MANAEYGAGTLGNRWLHNVPIKQRVNFLWRHFLQLGKNKLIELIIRTAKQIDKQFLSRSIQRPLSENLRKLLLLNERPVVLAAAATSFEFCFEANYTIKGATPMVVLEFLQTGLRLLVTFDFCFELLKQRTQRVAGRCSIMMMLNFVSPDNVTSSLRASLINAVDCR